MKTQKEIADGRRREKLTQVQEQVDDGTLKIRKMTAKEQAANPPRPREKKTRRR